MFDEYLAHTRETMILLEVDLDDVSGELEITISDVGHRCVVLNLDMFGALLKLLTNRGVQKYDKDPRTRCVACDSGEFQESWDFDHDYLIFNACDKDEKCFGRIHISNRDRNSFTDACRRIEFKLRCTEKKIARE